MKQRLDEGEGSKAHSSVKIVPPTRWQKIAKRSKKYAMKMAAYPEKKVKFNQKIRKQDKGKEEQKKNSRSIRAYDDKF